MKAIFKFFTKDRKISSVMIILLISSFIFVFDQISKLYVVHFLDLSNRLSITVLPGFIYFKMAWNEGINFGLFANSSDIMRIILIIISILICIGILFWAIKQRSFFIILCISHNWWCFRKCVRSSNLWSSSWFSKYYMLWSIQSLFI